MVNIIGFLIFMEKRLCGYALWNDTKKDFIRLQQVHNSLYVESPQQIKNNDKFTRCTSLYLYLLKTEEQNFLNSSNITFFYVYLYDEDIKFHCKNISYEL